ncbi:MAG: hydrogen peroxide-inducible genes activator [Saprospiraceae bacterium]|nr:MAG: transcriptional regulator [Bacteroidetes bacterium OLB9]MCO6463791.1 hydrogen peroxide-inducible genes activator [Saprospiraceae bacterium]MCZ2338827.1 hydrogen peroxide-inducible genes activator [Chitinophagales bacterium]
MNIQVSQLRYFLSLASTRSYSLAAELCNVSQPALSMAIRRMEEELNLTLIDRKSNPISLTEEGEIIASQATKIMEGLSSLEKLASDLHDNHMAGNIKLSIIPTLAPYILPGLIKKFSEMYPKVELIVEEETTKNILNKLKSSEIDVAVLVTPVEEKSLIYVPMFYEEFFLFTHKKLNKRHASSADLDYKNLWLLQEGHCMREQMLRICEHKNMESSNITYNAGSIESLINITEYNKGMTIIPEMATWNLSVERKERITPFNDPVPVREVSIMYHKFTTRLREINAIMHIIVENVPSFMKVRENFQTIDIAPLS